MKLVEFVKLPEVLKLVSRPRYVLGTTYTLSLAFFESAVFPELDRSQLKSCLIICDTLGYHNALTEAAALQAAAQDYMVVPAPVSGSFHAKVWLIIGEGEAVLLTGSGNLTQAGFMTNAELFDAVHFTTDSPPSAAVLTDLRSFITGLAGMWRREDREHLLCVETLTHMNDLLSDLPVGQDGQVGAPRFLHSFRGALIDQLPAGPNAKELFIASPYFGDSPRGLDLLVERYPTARLNLFPAVHSGNATNIPLLQLRKARKSARVSRLDVAAKKGAFAHLKIYGVAGEDEEAWIYCTSANCTQAAWQGPNIEAGLLRTVSRSVLTGYFAPSDEELPTERVQIEHEHRHAGSLQCWATDTGAGLELQMSNDDLRRFPLHEVTITVRAGSGFAVCQRVSVFQEACFVHLPWTAFAGWQRRRKVALSLELQGLDAGGKPARACCLVENKLLLSADPIHRSAWRGAQALLDAEGAPELGDIAAVFSLARDVFDGNLIRVHNAQTAPEATPPQGTKENAPPGLAVWPPQPDTHELRKRIGPTALGQLQWFQQILRAFLQNPASTDPGHEPDQMHVGHSAYEPDVDDEPGLRDEAPKSDPAQKKAHQLWESAYKDYGRLREKLSELCPSAGNAANIWPASLFAFLSTMAVFRSVKRLAPDISSRSSLTTEMLCDDFFRAMFSQRNQHEDFCCPRGFRYRSEEFPPLAWDLRYSFKIHLHPDLASVLLALILDRRMRNPLFKIHPASAKQQLDLICDQTFSPGLDTRESCRRVWRRYICDESRKATDQEFEAQFDALFTPVVSAAQ